VKSKTKIEKNMAFITQIDGGEMEFKVCWHKFKNFLI